MGVGLLINKDFLIKLMPWVINFSYFIILLPQIILNHRIKTTKGLSDLYLLGYFTGYALNLFYVYGLDLPLAYKILGPLPLLAVSVIILQRFLYKDIYLTSDSVKLYLYNLLLIVLFIPLTIINPFTMGNLAGWLLMATWSLYQIPQLFNIYSKKSVAGFSFYFVSCVGIGSLIEFIVSLALHLPKQSLFISLRGFIIYLMFCVQFWLYKE